MNNQNLNSILENNKYINTFKNTYYKFIGLIILIIFVICIIKNIYSCVVILLLLSILFLQIKQNKNFNINFSQILSYIKNKLSIKSHI